MTTHIYDLYSNETYVMKKYVKLRTLALKSEEESNAGDPHAVHPGAMHGVL